MSTLDDDRSEPSKGETNLGISLSIISSSAEEKSNDVLVVGSSLLE
jgi:hypothetical protein